MSDDPKDPVKRAFDEAESIDPGPPPQDAVAAGQGSDAPPPASPDPVEEKVRECLPFPLNDYGNGQRVCVHLGDRILFVPRMSWFCWDGRRWAPDEDALLVRRLAHGIAPLIVREANLVELPAAEAQIVAQAEADAERLDQLLSIEDPDAGEKSELRQLRARAMLAADLKKKLEKIKSGRRTHAKNAGNSGPISNMLAEAQPYSHASIADLNADPLLVCVGNGTIRLTFTPKGDEPGEDAAAQAELQPHDRDHKISKIAAADYDPSATCPTFDAFLKRIQPKAEMRAFLKRWFGYSLTGLAGEQKLVFFHGGGRNGKSTLVDIVAKIMGDYATTVPIESLTGSDQRKGADATPDLVRLPAARMVRAAEPEEGAKVKEAFIKQVTGGEAMMIRRMREEFVEIDPVFKLTVSGNHKPNVKGTDEGIWRRLLLVPFDEQIPKNQVDRTLSSKLWAERSGILNWMVEGALEYLEEGLAEPDEVLAATDEFREESDPVKRFLDVAVDITGDAELRETAKEMALAFQRWQRDNGLAEWQLNTVSKRLKEKAGSYRNAAGQTFASIKSNIAMYTGIQLKPGFRAGED